MPLDSLHLDGTINIRHVMNAIPRKKSRLRFDPRRRPLPEVWTPQEFVDGIENTDLRLIHLRMLADSKLLGMETWFSEEQLRRIIAAVMEHRGEDNLDYYDAAYLLAIAGIRVPLTDDDKDFLRVCADTQNEDDLGYCLPGEVAEVRLLTGEKMEISKEDWTRVEKEKDRMLGQRDERVVDFLRDMRIAGWSGNLNDDEWQQMLNIASEAGFFQPGQISAHTAATMSILSATDVQVTDSGVHLSWDEPKHDDALAPIPQLVSFANSLKHAL